jgi:ABC-type spermidine/putrescine transport system permease subunit I
MVLEIYVALERIDPRLVEAAQDLYATRAAAFRRVVLPPQVDVLGTLIFVVGLVIAACSALFGRRGTR